MSTLAADEKGLIVTCPNCSTRNRAPYEKLNEQFRCRNCHYQLSLAGEDEGAVQASAPSSGKNNSVVAYKLLQRMTSE
jgi:hypothetical protein